VKQTAGAPGTFLIIDRHGNLDFGFSVDLYKATMKLIDSARDSVANLNQQLQQLGVSLDLDPGLIPTSGFTVVERDYEPYSETAGLVPSLLSLEQERLRLVALLPGQFQSEYQQLAPSGRDEALSQVLFDFARLDPDAFRKLESSVNIYIRQEEAVYRWIEQLLFGPYLKY